MRTGPPSCSSGPPAPALPILDELTPEGAKRAQWRSFSTRSLEGLMEGQAKQQEEEEGVALALCSASDPGCCPGARAGKLQLQQDTLWPVPGSPLQGGRHTAPAHPGAAGCPAVGRAFDRGDIPQSCQQDSVLGAVGGPGPWCRHRPGKPACAAAGHHLEGLPPKHPLQAPREQPLRGLDGSHAEDQQGGEDGRPENKLPAANLLLLKWLLSLLQHIGHNTAASKMSCSNLAICVGPNLLSPPNEDLLPLEAMLEVTEKVKVLVEFLMENCRELFGEETTDPSCPAAKESPALMERSRGLHLDEQNIPAVTADTKHRAEALPHSPPPRLVSSMKQGEIGWWSLKWERGRTPDTLPLLQCGSPAGSQVLPENLLQHGLLSPRVHRSCQEPAPVQASHRVTASFGHPPAPAWGPPRAADTSSFASDLPRERGRLPGAPRRTGEPFRGKKVCRLSPGQGKQKKPKRENRAGERRVKAMWKRRGGREKVLGD
ncbi:uncharacterized protein ACIBXB_008245 isoform 1-T1 [Morphnus guianensis]